MVEAHARHIEQERERQQHQEMIGYGAGVPEELEELEAAGVGFVSFSTGAFVARRFGRRGTTPICDS
jgi:hypothetical protein